MPVENMSLQAKAEYNQYAAAQGLPQYNSQPQYSSQMGSYPGQMQVSTNSLLLGNCKQVLEVELMSALRYLPQYNSQMGSMYTQPQVSDEIGFLNLRLL